MTPAVFALLEAGANRLLSLDPEASSIMAPLRERRIAVHVEGVTGFSAEVTVLGDRVLVSPCSEVPADVSIRGTPVALASLLRRAEDLPGGAEVVVSGEVAVLDQVRTALRRLRPDWDELVARVAGDELGHPLARGLRALAATASRAVRELEANAGEYLREEVRWVARPEQIREFVDEVDLLRDAVARLEKRVEHLESDS